VLISGREATRILHPVTRGDAQARLLLRTGLAGGVTRTGAGSLYDEASVRALVDRPMVQDRDLLAWGLTGLYVARLPRTTGFRAAEPWIERVAAVSVVPPMSAWTLALISVRVAAWGRLPWVATASGVVAVCADLVGFASDDEQRNRFVLEPPGLWRTVVEDRRWPTRPGGRPWHLWDPLRVREAHEPPPEHCVNEPDRAQ
jgi:hypothetical protein